MIWLDKAAIKMDPKLEQGQQQQQPCGLAGGGTDTNVEEGRPTDRVPSKTSDKEAASGQTLATLGNRSWALDITLTHVQEVKIVCSLLPILATNLVFQMIYNNIFTLFISQGMTNILFALKYSVITLITHH